MGDIMHIGISALMAYQSALNVASQNIANADTPYYSRRTVDFKESAIGQGVDVADVRRIFDETTNRYLQLCNSDTAKWDVAYQQLSAFEPLLDNDNTSVGKFINDSLSALQQIQNNFNPSNRALCMSRLQDLASQFQNVNAEIARQVQNVNLSLQTEVKQVNNILGSLDNLNKELANINNSEHPELLDQREGLVQQLAKYFNFTAQVDQNGMLDISLSNGLSLLSGSTPGQLTIEPDPTNPANVVVGAQVGSNKINIDGLIQSGEISGWLHYRDNGLYAAQTSLGRLALVFAQTLNDQNKLGVDGNGNLGGNIFSDINSTSMKNSRVLPNDNNVGTSSMNVNIDDVGALNPSDYRLSIGPSNSYVLTRLSDKTIVSSGTLLATFPQAISVDGFSLNITSGTFTQGDQYIISPTNGASNNFTLAITDPSQIALGWPVNASEGTKQPGSNGTIEVKSITDISNGSFSVPHQLSPPIEVRFSVSAGVTQYSLYDSSTSTLIEGPIAYDPNTGTNIFPTPGGYDPGYRVSISGNNIQDGDTFNIQYNTDTTSDNRNARAMGDLYSKGTALGIDGKKVSFSQAYTMLSSNVSVTTNEAATRYQTSDQVRQQAEARRDSISGVSLEEESLDMARYQTAYQASAQVLEVARSIFDTIISMARG